MWDIIKVKGYISINIAIRNFKKLELSDSLFKAIFHAGISGLRSPGIYAWEDVTKYYNIVHNVSLESDYEMKKQMIILVVRVSVFCLYANRNSSLSTKCKKPENQSIKCW